VIRKAVVPVFSGLIVAIFAIAYLEKRSLEESLLREAFLQTHENVLREAPNYLASEFFVEPFSATAQERFQAFFKEIQTSPMLRMSLWNRENLILYSNLKSIIGYDSPRHSDLLKLFAEEKPFFIQTHKDDNWPPHSVEGEFLDIYIPIRIAGKVVGGVEIHSAVSGILSPVRSATYYTAAILVLSGIAILIVGLLARNLKEDRDRQTALARSNAELYERTKKQAVELTRSNTELEQFAYVASHDLQEPLRMITGYLGLLAKRYKGKLDQDADDFIGFAADGAKRLKVLIADLLTYSRVGTRGKEFAPTDCGAVVAGTLRLLQIAIEESAATVTHDPLPTLMGDETQLLQLFQNLIGNAIKYRDSKPPLVHVSCKQEGGNWLFSVRDNGIGIDPKYAERIFVIFQRLHGRDKYAGTGIGLAVCKKIVERHGGKIWVESEPGKGATFYFTIPARVDDDEGSHFGH